MIRRLRPIGTPGYPLGTDELGRDMLARLIYGGRLSLFIGITPVVLAFCIGTTLGVVAGYVGGTRQHGDHAHRRRVLRLPLGAAGDRDLGRARRRHPQSIAVADDRVHPADRARRRERHHAACATSTLSTRRAPPAPAPLHHHARARARQRARADLRLCDQPDQGLMILAAGLSFLGLGTKPPEPEWGLMLNTLRTAIYVNPWVAALPGAMIFTVSICFNLLTRRPAERDGCPKHEDARRHAAVETSAARAAAARGARPEQALPGPRRPVRREAASCARSMTSPSRSPRARRSASSASPAAASRPPRGCSCT